MKNYTYFFILGHCPSLSVSEISKILLSKNNIKIRKISEEYLLIDVAEKINVNQIQDRLGGTIKIGEIFFSTKKSFLLDTDSGIKNQLLELFPVNLKKIYFGFSLYYSGEQSQSPSYYHWIKKIAITIKKTLKQKEISSRWVESKERMLSSVILQKNNILTKGVEVVCLIDGKDIKVGKTISHQKFEQYEFFDFSRPVRPIAKGMIPLKLAKIMINIANIKKDSVILDPFLGSGTILQQAILMGYNNLVGTDKDASAIGNSQKNIDWLIDQIKEKSINIKMFESNVLSIAKKIKEKSIDSIITEPYLGAIKSINIKEELKNLSELYYLSFKQFKKILKPNKEVVIIFPVFKNDKELYFLPILDKIEKNGWKRQNLVPNVLLNSKVVKITSRKSIIYSRPSQRVLREIFIFKKET
ncbi:hypothetical protein ISS06_02890 [Patescibacteria group bacterium]|nr:hypothetical protein [Patescibacteria group bacterium]